MCLGLAVFAGLAGAQVLSGYEAEIRHERSADIENRFLDFAFSGRVEVDENPSSAFTEFRAEDQAPDTAGAGYARNLRRSVSCCIHQP